MAIEFRDEPGVADREIRALLSDFFRSVETRDLSRFLSLFAPGERFTVFEDADMRDWGAFVAFATDFFQAIDTISFDLEQCSVDPVAEAASVATGIFSCSGMTVSGDRIQLRHSFTFVLVRRSDSWRISHVHESSLAA